MFEYKETEKFDIGTGCGEFEYDFFTIDDEDGFWTLMNHYGAIYRRFDYYLDGYKTVRNNTYLSPVVQAKMREHNANLCLTPIEKKFNENNVGIRQMVVNEQKPNGIYKTYFFYFYHFATVSAKDYFKRGRAYAKAGLHNAAIDHFSRAIKLDPNMGFAFLFRGISYLDNENYNKAIKNFMQAINFNSETSEPFSLRDLAYKEAGDFEKAKTDFTKALELNHDDVVTKEYLEEINKT
jgi:tetratricopeptide (TPR) repeat protein